MPSRNGQKFNRAFDLLDAFDHEHPELSGAELARRARVPRTTAARLLTDPVARGYLRYDRRRQLYRPWLRLAELGYLVNRPAAIVECCAAIVDELSVTTKLLCGLGVRLGDHVVTAHAALMPSLLQLGLAAQSGRLSPLAWGAIGRAILAFCPPEEIERLTQPEYLAGHHGAGAPRTPEGVRALVRRAREEGVARSVGELFDDCATIAAPVFDSYGVAVASVACLAFGYRAEELLDARIEQAVRLAARRCSDALRCQRTHHPTAFD
jgi:DNA-binding IclR family transcriptional regulator